VAIRIRLSYDLFAPTRVPSTFGPADDIPVPVDYVIRPGDTVNVQLFSNQNAEYFLQVSRDGVINFPEIGPINVSGLTFSRSQKPDQRTRQRIDERRAREHDARRAALDTRVRVGRRIACGRAHSER
jgi:hypothetical protein